MGPHAQWPPTPLFGRMRQIAIFIDGGACRDGCVQGKAAKPIERNEAACWDLMCYEFVGRGWQGEVTCSEPDGLWSLSVLVPPWESRRASQSGRAAETLIPIRLGLNKRSLSDGSTGKKVILNGSD